MGENFRELVKNFFMEKTFVNWWKKKKIVEKTFAGCSLVPRRHHAPRISWSKFSRIATKAQIFSLKSFFCYMACCTPGNNSSLILYTPVHSGPVVMMLGDKGTQLAAHESDYQLLFHVQVLGCINNGVVAVVCNSAPMSTVVTQFSLCGVFYLRSCR